MATVSKGTKKHVYFDGFWGDYWPSLKELEPYFLAPRGKEWFYSQGNDSGHLALQGVDGSEHLPFGRGRIDIDLMMWGNPDHGVLLIYSKRGGGVKVDFSSKRDLSRLSEHVYSLHDTALPIGLFIPFAEAWKAVKEFVETEGQLPVSIEWVANRDLPPTTFPPPKRPDPR